MQQLVVELQQRLNLRVVLLVLVSILTLVNNN
jgi:hypothetical protein